MRHAQSPRRALIAAVLAASLGGCAHMTQMADGQTDILVGQDQTIRQSLTVTAVAPKRLSYGVAGSCTYSHEYTTRGANTETFRYTVTRRAVGADRVLLSFSHDQGQGTVLLDRMGTLADFNLLAPQYGMRLTADNFDANGAWRGRPGQVQRTFRRDLTMLLPQILLTTPKPGEVVAFIADENGQVWARYVYRGLVRMDGSDAVLFDLVRDRVSRGRTQTVVIGFEVLSADGLLPIYQASNGPGGPMRTRRLSCQGR